jgi:hypothetical protein
MFRIMVFLCIICLLGAYAEIGKGQEVGGYSKEVIVSIPWGSKPGEIGNIPGINTQGPPSFYVDINNKIYLLDAGNKRVLIFNEAGDLVNYFPLDDGYYYGSSWIMYIEAEKSIYIHDYKKRIFSSYMLSGEFVQRIRYNEGIGRNFAVHNGKIIGGLGFISIANIPKGDNKDIQTVLHEDEIQYNFLIGGKYSGILYRQETNKYENGVDRYILNKPDGTAQIFEIKEVPLDFLTAFICETLKGESIFIASGEKREIFLKYNIDMKLISKIEDPDMFFGFSKGYYVDKPLVVNENGFIYTLNLDNNGAIIKKYKF